MKIVFVICFLITFPLIVNCQASQAKKEVLSSFCQLSLSEYLRQANLSFTDSYVFKIDVGGKPVEIRNSRSKYTNEEEAVSCISTWKFSGIAPNSVFHVYFSWKHGVGWTQMEIKGKEFSQKTILADRDCTN
jgi:hypothetical protein